MSKVQVRAEGCRAANWPLFFPVPSRALEKRTHARRGYLSSPRAGRAHRSVVRCNSMRALLVKRMYI